MTFTLPETEPLNGHVSEASQAKIEDALFMLDNGEDWDRAAARLGMTGKSLDRLLRRAGYKVMRSERRVEVA